MPIREQAPHPDANPYYNALEAQLEATKHALQAGRFISKEVIATRLRSGSGHDVISQNEIDALKSAFLAAGHIAYVLRRRLERGALVEDGRFCLRRDQSYRPAYDFFRYDPALWGDCSASADGAGIIILEHVGDLGYDPADADWWPIMHGPDGGNSPGDFEHVDSSVESSPVGGRK